VLAVDGSGMSGQLPWPSVIGILVIAISIPITRDPPR
jgi:hypothetical protein